MLGPPLCTARCWRAGVLPLQPLLRAAPRQRAEGRGPEGDGCWVLDREKKKFGGETPPAAMTFAVLGPTPPTVVEALLGWWLAAGAGPPAGRSLLSARDSTAPGDESLRPPTLPGRFGIRMLHAP